MPLKSGTRIGPYEVRSALGEGAMGVVFRAHDTKLQRDVALKVLPDHFAADPERLSRFQREGQLLASLNHPNIAQIYGLEQSGDSGCIVMELVEGETLDQRIKRGPVPFEEAMHIAKQIADALEAAHERGVIHRDLKPANIKVTPDGTVKVLDFGLAKGLAGENSQIDASSAPTISATADSGSMAGTILGSPGYMAPEQARGRPVDKRADIWAFGCVLYELLTGTRAFDGADMTEALGAIIHKDPAWERVPAKALPLLRRCLEKDPRRRLRDIGDAMPLLENTAAPVFQAPSKAWLAWVTLGAVAAAVASILAMSYFRAAPPVPDAVRFLISPPDKTVFDAYVAVSPDGRRVAFTAEGPDGRHLWVRDLDKVEVRRLEGTKDGGSPFWSADGKFIAFSVGSELKKIDPSGGPPQSLVKGENPFGVGVWSSDGFILIGQRGTGSIQKLPEAGGVLTPLTTLNKERGDVAHAFPSLLPDGRHFIYYVTGNNAEATGIYVGSLENKPQEQPSIQLLKTISGAIFVPTSDRSSGQILYLQGSSLMTQPFDVSALALSGEPTPVAEQVATVNAYAVFSASANGVLAYRANRPVLGLAVWMDRNGRQLGSLVDTPLVHPEYVALSPDGKRVALVANSALWVHDLGGRPPIKLTSTGAPATPIWTRDGQRIIYEPNTPEYERVLVSLAADGSSSKPEPVSADGHLHPFAWTPDGKELIAALLGGSNGDIVRFPPRSDARLETILETPAQEGNGGIALSPDGRWMAYTSNTTDNRELWVKPYGREGAPVRVSPTGGSQPMWSKNGRELFYRDGPNKVMSVAVKNGATFDFDPAVVLFEGSFLQSVQPPSWDLASNGQFLMLRSVDAAPSPITVILNWDSKSK
jgi:Tol biopolymer transport system component